MFIDIHAHAYRRPVPFVVQFPTVEELIGRYDEANIRMGCVLPVVSPEIYMPQANEDILEMAEQYPERIIPWCNIDPRALTNACDAPLDRIMRYYKDKGCKGIGEIMPNLPMNDPMLQNLFKHAEAVGLPVTFDGSDRTSGDFGLYDEPGLPQLEHTLQRFPNLVVLGHGPTVWAEISSIKNPASRKTAFTPDGEQVGWNPPAGKVQEEGVLQHLLRNYENFHGELSDAYSALARDEDYGPKFLTEFQDRLFFGSDCCCPTMPFKTHELLLAWRADKKISESVFAKIARENAMRLLGL
ncbi:MAG: amidohydrolase family protein [Lentisphaeria bacterium]